MKERDKKRGGHGVAILCGIILFLLPVLYVLSIGPFSWLMHCGLIKYHPWAATFYWPLTWACEQSDQVMAIFRWWQNLI